MYRIDNATATGSLPAPGPVGPTVHGFFAPGVTTVDGDWMNALQEELVHVITQSSGTPALSKTNRTQLKTAIEAYVASGIAPLQLARAWIRFDGTGTPSIDDSFNVSSITDHGTGDYTITFTNALPSANYTVAGSAQYVGSVTPGASVAPANTGDAVEPLTTGSARVAVWVDASGGPVRYDSPLVTITFIGG